LLPRRECDEGGDRVGVAGGGKCGAGVANPVRRHQVGSMLSREWEFKLDVEDEIAGRKHRIPKCLKLLPTTPREIMTEDDLERVYHFLHDKLEVHRHEDWLAGMGTIRTYRCGPRGFPRWHTPKGKRKIGKIQFTFELEVEWRVDGKVEVKIWASHDRISNLIKKMLKRLEEVEEIKGQKG